MTTLTLPFPPTLNNLYRNAPGKGRVKSASYKQWLTEAAWLVRQQRPRPVVGSYRLTIVVDRPDRRARDIDNLTKATSDLLKASGVIEDDSKAQSVTIAWAWSDPLPGGKLTAHIEPANAPIFLIGRAA